MNLKVEIYSIIQAREVLLSCAARYHVLCQQHAVSQYAGFKNIVEPYDILYFRTNCLPFLQIFTYFKFAYAKFKH